MLFKWISPLSRKIWFSLLSLCREKQACSPPRFGGSCPQGRIFERLGRGLFLLTLMILACVQEPMLPTLLPPTFERPTVVLFPTDTPTPLPTDTPPSAVPSVSTPVFTKTVTHTVQAGETLIVIAQIYGVTVEDILTFNHLEDPNMLRVGQELLIPILE